MYEQGKSFRLGDGYSVHIRRALDPVYGSPPWRSPGDKLAPGHSWLEWFVYKGPLVNDEWYGSGEASTPAKAKAEARKALAYTLSRLSRIPGYDLATSRDAFDRPSAERAALVKAVGLGPERLVHYQISTKELRRMVKTGERIKVGRDPQRIQKSPRDLTAGEINRALDQIDAKRSKLTDRFIAQGRGSETADETWKKSDPLAREWQTLGNRYGDLRNEIELRYGPRAPSRLPSGRGFGPRTR